MPACRDVWISGAACRLPGGRRLHQRSLSRHRPGREGSLFLLRRGAQDARPCGLLRHRGARHHRQRLRHAARVPLPRAALSVDPGPGRGRARGQTLARRAAGLSLQDPPRCPVPRRPLLHAEPERPPDPGGRRRRFRVCAGARRRSRRQQSGDQQLRADRRALPTSASGSPSCAARTPSSPRCRRSEQYARAGGIAGVVAHGDRELEIVLAEPNAQILYWFAMPFTAPVAWEAVAYYNGRDGRPHFADHAVGTGPYRLAVYEKQHRFTLERNAAWYGSLPANRDAPGAVFPTTIDARDVAEGRIDAVLRGPADCPSSSASSSTARRRTSRSSTSSCRATTTTAASSRRASMPWSRAGGCRPRCRRAACASTRRWSRPSSTSASTWGTRCSGRRPASAAASCARP